MRLSPVYNQRYFLSSAGVIYNDRCHQGNENNQTIVGYTWQRGILRRRDTELCLLAGPLYCEEDALARYHLLIPNNHARITGGIA